jgi:CDP-paratose 2-epimerase
MIFDARRPVLITGGAGFLGTNLAHRLLSDGQPVIIFDNLARPGVNDNLAWLRERHGQHMEVHVADVRDTMLLRRLVRRACRVFHFAAQVAVTSSLADPIEDFEVNARGTLNVLEAIRALSDPPPMLYTSTNKVYGRLPQVTVADVDGRYLPRDETIRAGGIGEDQPLDFHGPYGCSKGAADQYVLDYARVFRVPAVVFRLSSVYGPHQQGTEDQGWITNFVLRALRGEPINVYGDGRQVRDALHCDDLMDAILKSQMNLDRLAGRAFNIGGGVANAVSMAQSLEIIRRVNGSLPDVRHGAWRPADQRYYVSSNAAFAKITGWRPRVSVEEGVRRLHEWMRKATPAARPAAAAPGGLGLKPQAASARPPGADGPGTARLRTGPDA